LCKLGHMVVSTTSEEVFACFRRSCAPPPVGTGGSNAGGARGGDKARRAGIEKAKAQSVYHNKKKLYNAGEERGAAAEHTAVKLAGKIAKFKHDVRTGARKRKGSEPMVDKDTSYDKYRELQKRNKAKKAEASGSGGTELRKGQTKTVHGPFAGKQGVPVTRLKSGQYSAKISQGNSKYFKTFKEAEEYVKTGGMKTDRKGGFNTEGKLTGVTKKAVERYGKPTGATDSKGRRKYNSWG
jgi:hypothetical protein